MKKKSTLLKFLGVIMFITLLAVNVFANFTAFNKVSPQVPPVCKWENVGCWVSEGVAGNKNVCDKDGNGSTCTCGQTTACVKDK